ncbi:MAG: FHA domain-containing protein [Acidobacteriota bacterium]|nr:FHA domain-containing protein [Acidobacteriota bacterium]
MVDRGGRLAAYYPGDHVGIAGPNSCFLGSVASSSPAASRLWEMLRGQPDPAGVAQIIWTSGPGDFAAVLEGDRETVVILAGQARVEMDTAGRTAELTCPDGAEQAVYRLTAAPERTSLRIDDADLAALSPLPLAGGVVSAGALVVTSGPAGATGAPSVPAEVDADRERPAPLGPDSRSDGPEPGPADAELPAPAAPAGRSDGPAPGPSDTELPAPAVPDSRAGSDDPTSEPPEAAGLPPRTVALLARVTSAEETLVATDEIHDRVASLAAEELPVAVAPSSGESPDGQPAPSSGDPQTRGGAPAALHAVPDESDDDDDDGGYDHLFGLTVNRTVEEAAIRTAELPLDSLIGPSALAPPIESVPASPPSKGQSPQSDLPLTPTSVPPPPPLILLPTPPSPSQPAAPITAPRAGMIDSVPWSSSAAPPGPVTSGVSASAVTAPDHDFTVARRAHSSLVEQLGASGADGPSGPAVHAVQCMSGHLNPAHQTSCRVCGAAVPEQPPVTVPRPVLGVLKMSSGDEIVLDRSVLLGRSPSVGHLIDGQRPHIVKLPSTANDISRNHAEVRVDGWHVLVADLNSTNGTVVTRPGQPPERLRPNDAVTIEPGTVVSIADEITFIFVAT